MNGIFDSFAHHSYSRENLEKLGIPNSDIEYMTTYGLPILESYWFDNVKFYDESRIKRIDPMCNMIAVGSLYEFHYIAVNNDGVYLIDNGLSKENSSETDCCHINSSLELFVTFMSIYCWYIDKYSEQLDNDDECIARRVVAELEEKFLSLDKVALEDENSLWSVLIEEISYIYI